MPVNTLKPTFQILPNDKGATGSIGLPPAPKTLSREARAWWKKFNEDFDFDVTGRMLLQQALEAFDEMRAAQKLISHEGAVIRDRWGQRKPHPATAIIRDSRNAVLHAFQLLHLDAEPLRDGPGRPPGR